MKKHTYSNDQVLNVLSDIFSQNPCTLQKLTCSKSSDKSILNAQCKLFTSKGLTLVQLETKEKGGKVYHENIALEQSAEKIFSILSSTFSQLNIITTTKEYQIIKKKDCYISLENNKKVVSENVIKSHNKSKNYYFNDRTIVPFLIGLGIMSADGTVKQSQYDKFRQINKFLEYIDKAKNAFDPTSKIHIMDFCCGKGYLTFATYVYLNQICGLDVYVTGIDLKADVITTSNELAKQLQLDNLNFLAMDINDYNVPTCDLVISLHACNTATDIVLFKAITCGAKAILSSPCCHHELSEQLHNDDISFITSYPILHQRFSEMLTDSIRANTLKAYGYTVQVTEFIDLEGTGKNILINAILNVDTKKQPINSEIEEVKAYCKEYNVTPTLLRLLNQI